MAVVTIPAKVRPAHRGIRPLDPTRDLPEVVDLIALGFRDELGPQGHKMLGQMRRLTQTSPFSQLLYKKSASLPGYVWEENGHVVANLSLRRASASRGRGWIIGNVVVHPDFRRRGIGRALMETAMDRARMRDGEWVGLEVRANNDVARTLYKHLGFYDVGRTAHMIHPSEATWPEVAEPSRSTWRNAKSADERRWARLAASTYSPLQRRILEIYPGRYDFGGLDRTLLLWLRGIREHAWLQASDPPQRAVRARTDHRHDFHLWDLLLHPEQKEEDAHEAVALAMTTLHNKKHWPVVTTVEANATVVPVLKTSGFQVHRILVQMYCELN